MTLLTLAEAADRLGITGPTRRRKALRRIRALERRQGVRVLRCEGSGDGTRYNIDAADLRGLLDADGRHQRGLDEVIATFADEMRGLRERLDAVESEVRRLGRRAA